MPDITELFDFLDLIADDIMLEREEAAVGEPGRRPGWYFYPPNELKIPVAQTLYPNYYRVVLWYENEFFQCRYRDLSFSAKGFDILEKLAEIEPYILKKLVQPICQTSKT